MKIRSLSAVISATLVVACSPAPAPDVPAPAPAVPVIAAPAPAPVAPPPADAPPGKPGAPVVIAFAPALAPVLGQAVPVLVTVDPTASVDRLEVQIAASEGLSLKRGGATPPGARVLGQTWSESVTVTPLVQGTHQLIVTAITGSGDARRATVKVLPLQIGAEANKGEAVKVTPEGERIVETPAQESGG